MSEMNFTREYLPESAFINYLLGEFDEIQVFQFEEICFSNNKYTEELESIREELIDKYINNQLTLNETHKFESYFLQSPHHREKLNFSKRLAVSVKNEPSSSTVFGGSLIENTRNYVRRSFAYFGNNKLSTALASIIVLLMISAGIFYIGSRQDIEITKNQSGENNNRNTSNNKEANSLNKDTESRNGNETNTIIPENKPSTIKNKSNKEQTNSKKDEKYTDDTNSNSQTSKENNKTINNKQTNVNSQENNSKNPSPKTFPKSILGIFLPTRAFRSGEETKEAILVLNKKSPNLLPFQIYTPKDSSKTYLVIIKTVEGKEIWKSSLIQIGKSQKKIFLFIPRKALSDGNYRVEVFESNSLEENIDAYSFQVINKEN